MSTPKPEVMERKRDVLTVKVLKMKKSGTSEEGVKEGLRQLIAEEKNVPDDSKMELYNSVLQEVGDLIGLTTDSSAMDTSDAEGKLPSQPKPSESSRDSQQEPPSWLAPLLSAIGQQQPKASKKKFLDPDTFDGSQKKYPVFKQQLKAKFDADPEDFQTPRKVYDYTLMRTTGSAARIMLSFIEHANKANSHSMETFWDFLDSEFLDPHIVHRARDRLITITQGRRSVRDYNADFREQLLLSGATLDRDYQIALFRRGLNAKLQELLASYEPSTYNDLVGKAIKTSDELYRASVLSKGRSQHWYPSNPRPVRPAPSDPEPMDWQPTTANQGASQKRAKWVSVEERQRRKENRLCIQCGGDNHFVRNCPYGKPQPPHTSKIGKSSVVATPLVEDATDSEVDSEVGEE
jgi:hypothetical protein